VQKVDFLIEFCYYFKSSNKTGGNMSEQLNEKGSETKKVSKVTWVLFWLLVFAGLFAIVYNVVGKNGDEVNSESNAIQPKRPPLNAKVNVESGMLVVKNLNNYSWNIRQTWEGKAVKFEINDDFVYYHRAAVSPGKVVKIPIGLFANDKGIRFNLLIYKIKSLLISCEEDTGVWGY
jgi:hypothetical protein